MPLPLTDFSWPPRCPIAPRWVTGGITLGAFPRSAKMTSGAISLILGPHPTTPGKSTMQARIMTAIEITGAGGPEVLQQCSRPTPQPGAGQVLLKVAYAGVNR